MGQRMYALPWVLITWGAVGIGLNVGLARFTYGVMLPAIRRDLSLDYLAGGSLNAVHLAGYLIGTLAAPAILRRAGASASSKWAHLLVAVGALLCAAAPAHPTFGSWVLAVGRLTTGLGAGTGIVAILVVVFAAVTAQQRPLVSAAAWSGMGVAVIASGLLISPLLYNPYGWRAAFLVSAGLALAVAFFFVPVSQRPVEASAAPPGRLTPTRERAGKASSSQFLFGSYLAFGVAYVAFSTFAGAQLAAIRAPPWLVGTTWIGFGTMAIVGAALTVPIVSSARLKRFALIAATASGALGCWIAGMDTASAVGVGALFVGLGVAATPTIVSAVVRERCSDDDYPRVFSLATAALGAGQLVGPLAGGALADRFGPTVIPLFAAAAYVVAALLASCDSQTSGRSPIRPSRVNQNQD